MRSEPPRATGASGPTGQTAAIGRSITIRGEVTGDEDLLIQGRIDGSVDLGQHAVTVGPEGQVKAGIAGRVVTIEGRVEGDLRAEEQVILKNTARVQGDIYAPRVILEDGANFRGGVDMGDSAGSGSRSGASRSSEAKRSEPVKSSSSGSSSSAGSSSSSGSTPSGSSSSSSGSSSSGGSSKDSASEGVAKAKEATT